MSEAEDKMENGTDRNQPIAIQLPDDGELCVLFPVAKVVWWDGARKRFAKIGSYDGIDPSWNVKEFMPLGRDKV